ncbi:MAG TPA: CGP-CTERM sorting domain-containing protein [Rugosimonospora sp.]
MRKVLLVFGLILGLYLFGRAVVEPFVVNLGDPATYRHDWGGPSLIGVLAVHCGPGLIAGVAMVTALARRYGRAPAGSGEVRPDRR